MAELNINSEIKRRVSYKKKIANDYQRQKDIMDVLDNPFDGFRDDNKIQKFNINYDMLNGRLDIKLYDDPICLDIGGEKVKIDETSITHYPLTAQIGNSLYGEIVNRPFKPVVEDKGETSQTLRSKKFNDLLRELISNQIIKPIRDEVTSGYIAQLQNNPNVQMDEQQIAQLQQQVEKDVQSKTPEQIIDFMVNDFRTPVQREAQQLLDYLVRYLDIKKTRDESFRHYLATGECFIYVGDRHEEPVFEMVNPKYFTWGGSQNIEWVQDASWCRYESWLSVEDALQKYSEFLSGKTEKELKDFIEPIGGYKNVGDPRKDHVQRTLMIELSDPSNELNKKYQDVNYKTREGQTKIKSLYADIINKYGKEYGTSFTNYGIREVHFCWRDMRKMKRVTRLVNGEEKKYWFDEHYEELPEDIKVVEIWVNEVWEGTKLGSNSDALYLNIRPIPDQYSSIYNPFSAKLPYFGRKFSTFMNNSDNVAWVDLGKSWQKDFDVTMAQLKHDLKTNMGNLFFIFMELKPEGMLWQNWLNAAKDTGFLLSTLKRHGGSVDPNLLKSANLDRTASIANKIQLLEYYRNNLFQALNFNESRIGSIGQYATNNNIQQSQAASYNQTENLFETHRQVIEKALNALLNRAKTLYKNNRKRFLLFDDVSRMELEINPDNWYEESIIFVTTSADELRKVDSLKANMVNFTQNKMSLDGILGLALADTTSDVIDIMKKESRRMENMRQEEIQIQQQQLQAQLEANQRAKEMEINSRVQLEMAKLESQERRVVVSSDQFRLQNDVNQNEIADSLETARLELLVKRELENRKLDIKEKEIEQNKNVEREKMKSSEKIAEKQAQNKAKTKEK